MPVIMSVLGAVVMPHNLFLHSEIIQSRKWNLKEEAVIQRQLKFEFKDTLFSMIIGWAINSAMILMAAATFYQRGENQVDDLTTAGNMLTPLLGNEATVIFAIALLLAGLSSSITAGMAGGTIFSGIFNKPYDISTKETRQGVLVTMVPAALLILLIRSPFDGLIYSQMLLGMQLPITIFTQIYLTSSTRVMGKYANSTRLKITLWTIAGIVTLLNAGLLITSI
jgi:manganese transport protein